jgi:hypothetical protein
MLFLISWLGEYAACFWNKFHNDFYACFKKKRQMNDGSTLQNE